MGLGKATRILLIEDSLATAEIVKAYLNAAPGTVLVELVDTLGAALERIANSAIDLVIADLNLPDSMGLETLDRLTEATDRLIIVLTVENDPALREMAIARGAYDFLHKGQLSQASVGQVVRLATMQANTYRSLRESEAQFRSLLEEQKTQNLRFDVAINNMSQGLCFFDGDQRLIVCNDLYAAMYKLTRELVRPGTTLREIVDHRFATGCFPDMSRAEYLVWRDSIAISPDPSDTVVNLKDERTIAIHHQPMPDGGWVATHEDITERKHAEEALQRASEQLEKLAMHDPLTGLANRRKFAERFEYEMARVDRLRTPPSLLMVDIDHFKSINDQHGHLAGDACLKALAALLAESVREVDLVARFGGEEFVVLLPETSVVQSLLAAERMRRAVQAQPIGIGDGAPPVAVTISVGAATAAGAALTLDEILASADEAVYRAKHAGRNRVSA
jgi:diguanylate cyclase (GGDEF)-like protein